LELREYREVRLWHLWGCLGFDETGTALILTIFALQDSFGTACNVTGDGALTMILTGFAEKHKIEQQKIEIDL
jgi:Na+/H+-dicarboxylate symporter